ncbi:hypothetical protein EV294_105278 [Paenibacillus sp. BK033]|nr:DUF1453 domain-containing protein [Paenibacillus sp. BK033]TCM96411.1 hypothetical protein EV294_105278 [Paenibacillus sp. BK033]
MSQEKEVSSNLLKPLLVPGIFITWGLYTIFTAFSFINDAFIVYLICAVAGTFLGYQLYRRNHRFFVRNGALIREKNYLPLIIVLINFVIKYALNIYMHVDADAADTLSFNVLYTAISGISVGLLFGGIWNARQAWGKRTGRVRG